MTGKQNYSQSAWVEQGPVLLLQILDLCFSMSVRLDPNRLVMFSDHMGHHNHYKRQMSCSCLFG